MECIGTLNFLKLNVDETYIGPVFLGNPDLS